MTQFIIKPSIIPHQFKIVGVEMIRTPLDVVLANGSELVVADGILSMAEAERMLVLVKIGHGIGWNDCSDDACGCI
jgi:hypothetical protein